MFTPHFADVRWFSKFLPEPMGFSVQHDVTSPKAMRVLEPCQIEDFLCVYKDRLEELEI